MVTRIERIVADDLDQSTENVGTYRFALQGIEYEVDLSDPNIDKLRAALYSFIAVARRLPKSATADPASGRPGKNASPARHWWFAHQTDPDLPPFNSRGTIPHQVIAAMRMTDRL